MAFPIPPQTFRCTYCQWKKTITQAISDVRIPGFNHVDTCPHCGGKHIQQRTASLMELALARVGSLLGKQ